MVDTQLDGGLLDGGLRAVSGQLAVCGRPVWAAPDGGPVFITTHGCGRGSRGALLLFAGGSMAALCLGLAVAPPSEKPANAMQARDALDDDAPGSALPVTGRPAPDAIEATFTRRSYQPGQFAELRVASPSRRLTGRIYRAGHGREGILNGAFVTAAIQFGPIAKARIRVGDWPSGLYYLRLVARNGHYGYAMSERGQLVGSCDAVYSA